MTGSRNRRWSAGPAGILVCALAVTVAAGCDPKVDDGDGGDGGDGPDLVGHTFHAQSATDEGQAHAIVDGTTLTLSFSEGDQVSASSGCNSLGGSYAIEDGLLVITGAGWTEIGCDPETGAQETWYFDFLQSSPALTQDGDNLTLSGDVTEIEYLDKEVATPDLELVGPVWTVDTIIDGDSAGSGDWSQLATFKFMENGQVDVTTGCNTGGGNYTVEADQITFDEIAVTEEGCEDEIHQMLETGVLVVLNHQGPVTLEIDASRMWLEIPGAGLGLRAD